MEKENGNILVVEDDPDVRKLTVSLLGKLGYHVKEARDGAEALAILKQTDTIDLLLTDAILPGGKNGPDIAKEGKEIQPDLKVLYMSGYTEEAFANHNLASQKSILLQKPFHKAELAEKVQMALSGKVAHQNV
ncbi:MAG: response regulator, partial [Sneathiella sp.]|nr:response regulator [Sneathiella sp.]